MVHIPQVVRQQAMSMLNKNLDLDIQYYVSVDFAALTKAVDLLGGIDIDVDDAEIEHLNNYIVETSKVTRVIQTAAADTVPDFRHWTAYRRLPTAVSVILQVMTSSVLSVSEK